MLRPARKLYINNVWGTSRCSVLIIPNCTKLNVNQKVQPQQQIEHTDWNHFSPLLSWIHLMSVMASPYSLREAFRWEVERHQLTWERQDCLDGGQAAGLLLLRLRRLLTGHNIPIATASCWPGSFTWPLSAASLAPPPPPPPPPSLKCNILFVKLVWLLLMFLPPFCRLSSKYKLLLTSHDGYTGPFIVPSEHRLLCKHYSAYSNNVNIQLLFLHSQLTLYYPPLSGQYIFQAQVESLPNLNLFAFLYTSSKKNETHSAVV